MGMNWTTRTLVVSGLCALAQNAHAEEPPTTNDTPIEETKRETTPEPVRETKSDAAGEPRPDATQVAPRVTTKVETTSAPVATPDPSIDPKERDARDDERRAAEREAQRYRLELGVGLPVNLAGVGVANTGSAAALGSLGPTGSAGFETRLSGPAWLTLQAEGSFSTSDGGGETSSAWWLAPSVGVRLEAPVFDFVSVGGYGVAIGRFGSSSYERATGAGGVEGGTTRAFEIAGAFGASLHFRASSFFGVRLGLEVLRIGYRRMDDSWTDSATWGAFGDLKASPRVALTFSF